MNANGKFAIGSDAKQSSKFEIWRGNGPQFFMGAVQYPCPAIFAEMKRM